MVSLFWKTVSVLTHLHSLHSSTQLVFFDFGAYSYYNRFSPHFLFQIGFNIRVPTFSFSLFLINSEIVKKELFDISMITPFSIVSIFFIFWNYVVRYLGPVCCFYIVLPTRAPNGIFHIKLNGIYHSYLDVSNLSLSFCPVFNKSQYNSYIFVYPFFLFGLFFIISFLL